MVKLNSLVRLAAIGWFAVSTLPVACYAEDEQTVEPGEPDDEVAAVPTAQPPSEAAGAIDTYKEIVERPLFSASRRPPEPATEAAVPALKPIRPTTPAARADVVLLGVVITPDTRRAMLRSAGDKQPNLKGVGDDINGWELAAIEPRKVRLTRGTEEKVLELERKAAPQRKPKKRAAPRRRSAAAKVPGGDPAPKTTGPEEPAVSTDDPGKAAAAKQAGRRARSNTQQNSP